MLIKTWQNNIIGLGQHLPAVYILNRTSLPLYSYLRTILLGLLLRHYTQNIDTLERRADIPDDKLVEAHGTFFTSHCLDCRKEYTLDFVKGTYNQLNSNYEIKFLIKMKCLWKFVSIKNIVKIFYKIK